MRIWHALPAFIICNFLIITAPTPKESFASHSQEARHNTQPVRYFESVDPLDYWVAKISGNSCANLKGIFSSFPRKRHDDSLDEHLSAEENLEAKSLKASLAEKSDTGKYLCFPPVENLEKYFQKGGVLSSRWVFLKNGPILIHQSFKSTSLREPERTKAGLSQSAKWGGDKYRDVREIFSCSNKKDEFCARIDVFIFNQSLSEYQISSDSGTFRVFCWSCKKLQSSPTTLTKSFIQAENVFGTVFPVLLLNGGFMVPEKYIDKNENSNSRTNQIPLSRLRFLLSLMENTHVRP